MAHHPGQPPSGKPDESFPREIEEFVLQCFLEECPHALDHIRYCRIDGYDEPQMFLSLEGNRWFFRWLVTQGLATPAQAEAMIITMETFAEAHQP